jgi:glycine/D-amino acid oxidase-like deaminating enzyme
VADLYEVHTDRETYSADKIVLCAGPWTGRLLGGLIPLSIERQVQLWFDSRGDTRFSSARMPVFIMEASRGRLFYGIPDCGEGVKVARHHGGKIVDPDSFDRHVAPRDEVHVKKFAKTILPRLADSPAARLFACIRTPQTTTSWSTVIRFTLVLS